MEPSKTSMIDDIISRERKHELHNQFVEINADLTADNYEAFDQEYSKGNLGREYCQSNRLKGIHRSFQLYLDTHLFQRKEQHRKHEHQQYRISLACLQASPEQVQVLEWKWVSTAIATSIWAAILIYSAMFTGIFGYFDDIQPVHVVSAGILMATITVISLLLFLYSRKDLTIFNSYQADVPLIVMETDRPDEASFSMLKNDIIAGIANSSVGLDTQDILIAELKELRRLRDEAVIDSATYETARQRIFSHREYSKQS